MQVDNTWKFLTDTFSLFIQISKTFQLFVFIKNDLSYWPWCLGLKSLLIFLNLVISLLSLAMQGIPQKARDKSTRTGWILLPKNIDNPSNKMILNEAHPASFIKINQSIDLILIPST